MVRRVRTPDGAKYYGLPVGSPISLDDIQKARERNGGKKAPPRATSPGVASSRPTTAKRPVAAAKVPVRSAVATKIPVAAPAAPSGGPTLKVGAHEFSVSADSKTFSKGTTHFNIDAQQHVRVFTPWGEANISSPEQQAQIKGLMAREGDSLTPVEGHRSRFSSTADASAPPKIDHAKLDAEREARRKAAADQEAAAKETGLFHEYDPSARAQDGSAVETTPLSELGHDPEEEMTVYRGVPADAKGGIRPGDWVTPDERLARDYAGPPPHGKVVSLKAKAKDLRTDPTDDSFSEMVYSPNLDSVVDSTSNAPDESSLFVEFNSPSSDAARAVYEAALAAEPAVSETMKELALARNGQLRGFAARRKGAASLKRKIESDSLDKGLTPEEAAKDIRDSIRYTMQFDTADFAASAQSVLRDLKDRGYSNFRVKNSLGNGGIDSSTGLPATYRGINTTMISPEGVAFELQFHTPESFQIKEVGDPSLPTEQQIPNHIYYEERRVLQQKKAQIITDGLAGEKSNEIATINSRISELDGLMRDLASKIPTPPGVDNVR